MGIIGRFIDEQCEAHPHLMRDVMEKPLAPLSFWLRWDREGNVCGCLIGTMALAAGFEAVAPDGADGGTEDVKRSRFLLPPKVECVTDALYRELYGAKPPADYKFNRLHTVGSAVAALGTRVHSDRKAVHLLRQRIARQLAIRESRMAVAALPNEPVEATAAGAVRTAALSALPPTGRAAGGGER